MGPTVSLRDVTLRFGGTEALRDVSVQFPGGKSTVIVGPSGCGKSALLKVAAGILVPDTGEVLVDDRPISRMGRRELEQLRRANGFVFQDAALWANKSVFENLSLPLQLHNRSMSVREISMRVLRLLEAAEFTDPPTSRPSQLSTGEQKIVSFLRAIVCEPSLLFMDEPTTSVDHTAAERVMGMVRALKESGATLVTVTHESKLASLIADNLVVLNEGAVLEAGPTASVVRSSRPDVIRILSEILSEAATYDTDLLDLLGREDR